MKLGILVAYKFLTKNLNFGASQSISGHVIPQNMEFIRLAISQVIFKDRNFWFGPKNSIKLCAEHCIAFGVVKCISAWSRDWTLTIFL